MHATRTSCDQNGRTRLGKKKRAILVFAILAMVFSWPLYILNRSPKNQEFLSNYLDHVVFAKVCRTVMESHSTDAPQFLASGWDDEKISALPDAIRILKPEKIWISTNEVKLIFHQMVWVYGLHAIAKQDIQGNNNSLGVEVNFFKERTKK